jgi:hypothetical protein
MDRSKRSLLTLIASIPSLYLAAEACTSLGSSGATTNEWINAGGTSLDEVLGYGLLRSEIKGELSDQDKEELWLLFQQIGIYWHLIGPEDHWKSLFLQDISLKTGSPHAPSYYTEYQRAAVIFRKLRASARKVKTGLSPELAAFAVLIRDPRQEPSVKAGSHTSREHARSFVIAEFCALYLAYGGFKGFTRAIKWKGRGISVNR